MITKIISGLLILISLLPSSIDSAQKEPTTSAKAAFLYEVECGNILYAKNENLPLPMASTTKIMTALIALETLDLEKTIVIKQEAVGIEGSSVYLPLGAEVKAIDLIYSVLLQSANDAAAALAIEIGGSIEGFAYIMNKRALDIGATNTNFKNPHGLDHKEHYTTARDLALISTEALKNPIFKKICGTYKYTFSISDSTRTVVNHNKLLRSYSYAIGIKTGYTTKSGRCLVSAAEKDGITLIAVTLNAPNDWADHTAMLNFGFNKLTRLYPEEISKTSFEIPVIGGKKQTVKAEIDRQSLTPIIYTKTSEKPSAKVFIKKYLVAPINRGDEVGYVIYTNESGIIAKARIIATDKIDTENHKRFGIKDLFKGAINGKNQTSEIYIR